MPLIDSLWKKTLFDLPEKITTFLIPPFNEFEKIIVCGPQRSGTRFVAKSIANTFNYLYYDDTMNEINRGDRIYFLNLCNSKRDWVVHGPGYASQIHMHPREDVLVVWMKRKTEDVVTSENRVSWRGKKAEEAKLPPEYRMNAMEGKQCERRQRFWKEVQRDMIPCYIEVDYESLNTHPLYTPKDKRVIFGAHDVGF